MSTSNQICACDPCACAVSVESAVEKDGKVYCSQPCADGHAGSEECCNSCDCC
ncbi:metallothionein [Synechococcus sp. WH 8016]|uniref:metallothionein n=1 Tax=Synechococcus sp. WH 8016 TaxID=166318 RepID=UPI0008FEE465|nr:metallothionein [Synechococcus sp. WH 8016]